MKILHFIGSIDKSAGGTATYIHLLTGELIKWADLVVVTSKSPKPLDLNGVKLYTLDWNLSRWWSLRTEFRNILKLENPDLVHIHGIWNPQNWLFQQACSEMRIKVILSPHGMLEPYILKRNFIKKRIALALYQRKAIQSVNFLHTTASAELSQIRKLGFTAQAEIIPNGIDISNHIQKSSVQPSTSEINILFLSRIHPKKGLELLIEAIKQIKEPYLKVIIAGEGEESYVEKLKNLCIEKEVDHLIDFVGGVYGQHKWELFARSHLFILPSYSENFGLVVIEALAAGVPVITTKETPWEELNIRNCGWWIDLSISNLTKTIKEALALSRKEREEMGENGRRLVQQKYRIQAVARKTYEFYRSAVSKDKHSFTYSNN